MFVALDLQSETAVSGADVAGSASQDESPPCQDDSRYSCLLCDAELVYTEEAETPVFEIFQHQNREEDCIKTGNVSDPHRLGQEVTSKMVYNWIPGSHVPIEIDLERRVGGPSDFVIADVRAGEPVRLAVEIVYQSSYVSVRRRLRRLFDEGYGVMLVCVKTGRVTPARIEHHLQRIGPIRVGRFDPTTLDFKFGSVVTAEQVSLDEQAWERLPAYLS